MAFDPDAYLNSGDAGKFDPDAYLGKSLPKARDVSGWSNGGPDQFQFTDKAIADAKDIGHGMFGLAKKYSELPQDAAVSAVMAYLSKKPMETPLAEDAKAVGRVALSAVPHKENNAWVPGGVFNRAKEITTDPIGSFNAHPLKTLLDVSSVASPLMEGAEAMGLGSKLDRALESAAQYSGMKALGNTKRFINTPEKLARAKVAAQAMLEQGAIKPWSTPENMAEKVSDIQNTSGRGIGEYLKAQGTGFDPKAAIEKLESLKSPFEGGLYDKTNNALDTAIETIKAHGDSPISWQEANDIKGLLQKNAKYNSATENVVNETNKEAAGAFRQHLDDSLGLENADSSGKLNPDFEQFLKDKKIYGAAKNAEDSLANKISSEKGNKMFGLTDWIAGSAGAYTHDPRIFGVLLAKKLAEKFGPQTAAWTANKLRAAASGYSAAAPYINGPGKLGIASQFRRRTPYNEN